MREHTKKLIELAMEGDTSVSSSCRQAINFAMSGRCSQSAPSFLSQAEAARELGVSRQSIYNLVKAGKLHPVEVTPGGLLRYRYQEVTNLGGSK